MERWRLRGSRSIRGADLAAPVQTLGPPGPKAQIDRRPKNLQPFGATRSNITLGAVHASGRSSSSEQTFGQHVAAYANVGACPNEGQQNQLVAILASQRVAGRRYPHVLDSKEALA